MFSRQTSRFTPYPCITRRSSRLHPHPITSPHHSEGQGSPSRPLPGHIYLYDRTSARLHNPRIPPPRHFLLCLRIYTVRDIIKQCWTRRIPISFYCSVLLFVLRFFDVSVTVTPSVLGPSSPLFCSSIFLSVFSRAYSK